MNIIKEIRKLMFNFLFLFQLALGLIPPGKRERKKKKRTGGKVGSLFSFSFLFQKKGVGDHGVGGLLGVRG